MLECWNWTLHRIKVATTAHAILNAEIGSLLMSAYENCSAHHMRVKPIAAECRPSNSMQAGCALMRRSALDDDKVQAIINYDTLGARSPNRRTVVREAVELTFVRRFSALAKPGCTWVTHHDRPEIKLSHLAGFRLVRFYILRNERTRRTFHDYRQFTSQGKETGYCIGIWTGL